MGECPLDYTCSIAVDSAVVYLKLVYSSLYGMDSRIVF